MRTRDQLLADAIAALTEAALLPHRDAEVAHDDLGAFAVDALTAAVANVGGIHVAMAQWQRSTASSLVRDLVWQAVGDPDKLWSHRTSPLFLNLDVDALIERAHPGTHAAWEVAVAHADDRVRSIAQPDISPYAWVYDRTGDGHFVPRDADAPAFSWDLWRHQDLPEAWAELDLDDFEQGLRVGLRPHTATPGDSVGANVLKGAEEAEAWAKKMHEHDEWVETFERLREDLLGKRQEAWSAYGGQVATRFRNAALDVPGLSVPIDVELVTDPLTSERPEPLVPDSLEAELLGRAVRGVEPPPPPF